MLRVSLVNSCTMAVTILIGCVWSATVLATGPSWISATLYPISVNQHGDILCRTRFQANPTGGYEYMPVEYGLAIITDQKMLEYPLSRLIYTDDIDFYQQVDHYDNQLSACHIAKPTYQELKLRQQYGFSECNISQYQQNTIFNIVDFVKKYQFNSIESVTVLSLKELKSHPFSLYHMMKPNIQVSYDFGHVLLIHEQNNNEDITTLYFDYPNYSYKDLNIGYDIQSVSGVLFLKQ